MERVIKMLQSVPYGGDCGAGDMGGEGSCDVYKDLFLHTRRDGNEDRAGRS